VPAPTTAPAPAPTTPAPAQARARNWDEYHEQAARRIVAANAGGTYLGVPPEPLLAIPVLEVLLNADGSIRQIRVLREPPQARDTVQLAIDAVRRSAPFASPAHLPTPWRYVETFLFDDARRFKPRSLDLR
jgi:hypothetical protein